MKRLLFWLGLLLCLGVPFGLVLRQENLRRGSVVVYLRLAPDGVDLSGNHVSVRFDLNLRPLDPSWPTTGFLQPSMDSRRVINAWAPAAAAPPGERIHYQITDQQIQLNSTSMPLPRGKEEAFRQASYAKFDLALDGRLTLRGLTDRTLNQL
jgi:hypothetical protein